MYVVIIYVIRLKICLNSNEINVVRGIYVVTVTHHPSKPRKYRAILIAVWSSG